MTPPDALARLVAAVEAQRAVGPVVCWEHSENCCADWCIDCSQGEDNIPKAEQANKKLMDALDAARTALAQVADRCEWCGSLDWTRAHYGKSFPLHKHACQHRQQCQSHPTDCIPDAQAETERERDALRATVADLTASLKVAQETIRTREAAQWKAEEMRDQQIQAAYVAQEAQIAQGWKLREAEETIARLRRVLDVVQHGAECALPMAPCTCGLDTAREG